MADPTHFAGMWAAVAALAVCAYWVVHKVSLAWPEALLLRNVLTSIASGVVGIALTVAAAASYPEGAFKILLPELMRGPASLTAAVGPANRANSGPAANAPANPSTSTSTKTRGLVLNALPTPPAINPAADPAEYVRAEIGKLVPGEIEYDVLPDMPSFMRRVCSGYAPRWGVLQTPSV
jgi:hypothetical protein